MIDAPLNGFGGPAFISTTMSEVKLSACLNLPANCVVAKISDICARLVPIFGPRGRGRDAMRLMEQAGLAPSTIVQSYKRLNQALRDAVMQRKLVSNPCD